MLNAVWRLSYRKYPAVHASWILVFVRGPSPKFANVRSLSSVWWGWLWSWQLCSQTSSSRSSLHASFSDIKSSISLSVSSIMRSDILPSGSPVPIGTADMAPGLAISEEDFHLLWCDLLHHDLPPEPRWLSGGVLTDLSRLSDPKAKGFATQGSGSCYQMITVIYIYGSVSKPCTPVVHIKIAGIYGCSSP